MSTAVVPPLHSIASAPRTVHPPDTPALPRPLLRIDAPYLITFQSLQESAAAVHRAPRPANPINQTQNLRI